jgi:hypothetical protein
LLLRLWGGADPNFFNFFRGRAFLAGDSGALLKDAELAEKLSGVSVFFMGPQV